jgi:hypothetical protein
MEPAWKIYEDTARKVLTDLRKELSIQTVEGKQTLSGVTGWEIDAKAWCENSDNFLVIEVRRHTKAGLTQEAVAAIAYRIQDVGGSGGVIVSPRPLQKGAKPIATSANISHVKLTPESTTESVQLTDACDASITHGTPSI